MGLQSCHSRRRQAPGERLFHSLVPRQKPTPPVTAFWLPARLIPAIFEYSLQDQHVHMSINELDVFTAQRQYLELVFIGTIRLKGIAHSFFLLNPFHTAFFLSYSLPSTLKIISSLICLASIFLSKCHLKSSESLAPASDAWANATPFISSIAHHEQSS